MSNKQINPNKVSSIRLGDELTEKLKIETKKRGLGRSALVRLAVERYLNDAQQAA